ncbi:hypothetical protein SJI00_07595 [Pseudomonas sp. RP23018S]|uniref:hypothetical protein n=1 Tax=Pseudomonas sp. RP23018S TaxID=3096037 RepID=UPI002ACA4421|nr:hypothetical protein [Pseudomonas sp. RP23018S]MDZ5602632.1 hypothetical protein [Pseudomonas sp. RP23018S]
MTRISAAAGGINVLAFLDMWRGPRAPAYLDQRRPGLNQSHAFEPKLSAIGDFAQDHASATLYLPGK